MSVAEICTIVTTLVGIIPGVVGLIVFVIKLLKNKDWDAIKKIADNAMKTVEEKVKAGEVMTSDQKLDLAIKIIKEEVEATTGIKWEDKMVDQLKSYIKVSIDWFNSMKK